MRTVLAADNQPVYTMPQMGQNNSDNSQTADSHRRLLAHVGNMQTMAICTDHGQQSSSTRLLTGLGGGGDGLHVGPTVGPLHPADHCRPYRHMTGSWVAVAPPLTLCAMQLYDQTATISLRCRGCKSMSRARLASFVCECCWAASAGCQTQQPLLSKTDDQGCTGGQQSLHLHQLLTTHMSRHAITNQPRPMQHG